MKVAVIGTVGLPAAYGGFETLVEFLTKYLGTDFDFTVYCSSKAYTKKIESHNGAKLKYLPFKANGIQSVAYDSISIVDSLCYADTLLVLGISGCIVLPFIKAFHKKKIIVNIDGLEWKRGKWGKFAKRYLRFSEKMAIKYADVIITDNLIIQNYVKKHHGKDSVLIEYGADHVHRMPMNNSVIKEIGFSSERKYAFAVCRIEPENNIHVTLEAFSKMPEYDLIIVGNWSNSDYGENLKKKYSECKNIFMPGPIYDIDKLNILRSNCFAYIHGHSAGGTNPSLVEAMYAQISIVAFDIGYNRETTENKALYFKDADSLIRIVKSTDEKTLNEVALSLFEVAQRKYTWKKISQKYAELF